MALVPSPILIADKCTVTFSAEADGKVRVIYQGWDDAKIVVPGQFIHICRGPQGIEFRLLGHALGAILPDQVTGLLDLTEDSPGPPAGGPPHLSPPDPVDVHDANGPAQQQPRDDYDRVGDRSAGSVAIHGAQAEPQVPGAAGVLDDAHQYSLTSASGDPAIAKNSRPRS
jgi:hypothetical protein